MIETIAKENMVTHSCMGKSTRDNAIQIIEFRQAGRWVSAFVNSQVHFYCGPEGDLQNISDKLDALRVEVDLVRKNILSARAEFGNDYSPPIFLKDYDEGLTGDEHE